MFDFLFYLFATSFCFSSIAMICSRNLIHCAIFMMTSCLSVAGLFFLIDAYFLALIEILIYSGAVIVLFSFIVTLTGIDFRFNGNERLFLILTVLMALCMIILMINYLFTSDDAVLFKYTYSTDDLISEPTNDSFPTQFLTTIKSFGMNLFIKYILPFQVIGFILLSSVIGVVIVGKKNIAQQD